MTYELQESPSIKTRDHQHTTEFPEKQTKVVRFCLIGWFLHVAWPQTHTNVYFWHPVIFSSDSECHTAYNTKCPCWVLAEYHVISSQTEHFWDHSGRTSHVLRPVATSFVSILHSKNILQKKKNPTRTQFCSKMRTIKYVEEKKNNLIKPAVTVSPSPTRGKKNNRNTWRGRISHMKDWLQVFGECYYTKKQQLY